MEAKKKRTAQSRLQDEKRLSFFDVDARAELRSVPFPAVWFPPRVGEQIDLRAEVEHGGGLYVVVGVRHVLEDSGPLSKQLAAVVGVVVDVKPQHEATVKEAETASAVDRALEELVSIPVAPLPVTLELPLPPEPDL